MQTGSLNMADGCSKEPQSKEDDELDELLDSKLFPRDYIVFSKFSCLFVEVMEIKHTYCGYAERFHSRAMNLHSCTIRILRYTY